MDTKVGLSISACNKVLAVRLLALMAGHNTRVAASVNDRELARETKQRIAARIAQPHNCNVRFETASVV